MARTRKIKVHDISLDVDETSTHWLIYVSPGITLAAQGIHPYRGRLAKCLDEFPRLDRRGAKCLVCRGVTPLGMADVVRRLLRSYPKVTVEVEAAPRARVTQRMPEAMRWAGPVRGWVAV